MYKFLLFCVVGAVLVRGAKLPNGVNICTYSDETCIVKSATEALKIISKGDPKIHLAALDPLAIDKIEIDQGDSKGPVAVKLSFVDAKLGGIKDIVFESMKGITKTPKGFKLVFKGRADLITLEGQYTIAGKVLILPLTGKGPFNIWLDGVTFTATLTGQDEPVVKNGKEYLKLESFDFKIDGKRLRINLEGLHNGDKVLSDSTNLFLNENWEVVFQELRPSVEQVFSKIFLSVTNQMCEKVPYSELFKPE